ncbi:tigger transposable element-derived protein 4 [Callorhinchus milii]|uniref:Tigger transposable element-derived protein 4-like n=1 Tax=Callorhinchus milii TaxID=7868 RepID=V9L3Z9_CALMI|nr:tigger transposable element-derived protein 4 [Callorhinchus milii]|eukprot:gi/632933848/ref/XP_007890259.1/ PREDICTED: tigger transposable element-derived protein 4-like [Callorhinchus milii]
MPPRKELSLRERVDLIKNSRGKSHRELAVIYGIGRTQVGSILKRKAEYMTAFEENQRPDRKRVCLNSQYEDIDKLTWKWFQRARGLNMPVSGPMIQEIALIFAASLGKPAFKASNGWLGRFKSRHNIGSAIVSGEKGDVEPAIVGNWKEKLPEITAGYAPKGISNMDESGVVFRALPDGSLSVCDDDCTGGKECLMEEFLQGTSDTEEQDTQEKEQEEQPKTSKTPLTYADALGMLGQVKDFCLDQGLDVWQALADAEGQLQAKAVQVKLAARQTTLDSFFKK